MRLASLLAASLLASLPAAVCAQSMDTPPGGGSAPGAAPAAGTPTEAAAAPAAKPEKNGPYVGFSFGTGSGTVYNGSSSLAINDALTTVAGVAGASGQSPTTLAMMLRFGWGSGDFLFGTQFNWIRSYVDINGTSAGYDWRAFDLVATLWSQEMGLYTRVGVGPSQYRVYVGSNESTPESGVELMLGVGATLGGLGVGLDLFRQNYDKTRTGFDYVNYFVVSLSADLY